MAEIVQYTWSWFRFTRSGIAHAMPPALGSNFIAMIVDMKDEVHYKRIVELPGLVLGSGRFSAFRFERHYHLDYHVGLVTEGLQRQRYKQKSALLGPGCIALMPPGEMHDGSSEDGAAYTLKTFRLSPELINDIATDLCGQSREPELAVGMLEDPLLAAHLLRLHHAMSGHDQTWSLAIQSEWLSLLHCLLRQSCSIKPQQVRGTLSPLQQQRIKEYCIAHLAEKITLDALAALCGLGRFYFLRQFKQTVGMTPHAWLVRLRLEQACAMLAGRPQSIAEIAQGVGFYDQSHFNRAFRQAFGVAPSHY